MSVLNTLEQEKLKTESSAASARQFTPAVDLYEKNDSFFLIADLPGVKEENIKITVEKNILTIQGRMEKETDEGYRPVHTEYGSGDFIRSFTLSEIDTDSIEARFKNGVLRLTMKREKPVVKTINVKKA
jgi:HSP20 family protein